MPQPKHLDPAYRAALIICVLLNILMFFAEGGIGLWIGSAALIADAADFLEDAGMYGLGIIAIGWNARRRAQAGLVMSLLMGAVGLVALAQVVGRLLVGGAPEPLPMGGTAVAALAVNVYCSWRLVPFRKGDASMRSIWLSTRNDAVLNLLTIIAAALVALTASSWPDIAAGLIIAWVNLRAAVEILMQANRELRMASGRPGV